jgi:hypothetical protein
MANYEKLYKKLHEEFELEFNEDFWRHKQSGKYIITHNAVKKIVAQQRKKGFVIQTPKTEEIITTTAKGPDGEEIVKQADFYLLDSEGNVLRHEAAIGEANEKNCRLAFRHTMAHKRMYDRGCLSLLQIAELGGYSDVEADDFSKSKNKTNEKPSAPKPTPTPPSTTKAQVPNRPAPPTVPRVGPPKKAEPPKIIPPKVEPEWTEEDIKEDLEQTGGADLIFSVMETTPSEDPRGHTAHQIKTLAAARNIDQANVTSALKWGLENGHITKSGEKRGTRYKIVGADTTAPSQNEGLSKTEYTALWREASEELRTKGIEYHDLMSVVNEVTGHNTAISAFNSGTLTKQHIAEIKRIGMLKVA